MVAYFTALSQRQTETLKSEIASADPGRMWILVVSPRSQSALGDLADPVFADLPAGTLLAVAEDPANPNQTNWWVGSSWEPSNISEAWLNNVIQSYRKGQGSLFEDLRREIRSFARHDAAAGHPALSSSSNPGAGAGSSSDGSGSRATNSGGSSGGGLPVALAVLGVIVLLIVLLAGGRYVRQMARVSHRRHEESADAHEQAEKDFVKLGEEITRLDVDSSLATADAAGKDEYRQAIGCYEAAEQRLKDADDAYDFQKAVGAIQAGLRHVAAADALFNPKPDPDKEIEELAQLAALHRSGALTDAEFAAQKAKLIN